MARFTPRLVWVLLLLCAAPAAAVTSRHDPRLDGARFFARPPGEAQVEEPLELRQLALDVTTSALTARTHLAIEVGNPSGVQREAVLRLPLPPGAAVVRAVLHVEGRPMEGRFVGRGRAGEIYRSITERRRDPALVVWDGPEWVKISIFPVEPHGARRFELEWVEPLAGAEGARAYRVPLLGQRGRLVARPAFATVDGRRRRVAGDWMDLGPAPAELVAARLPGEAFGLVLARTAKRYRPPRLVLVAETSAAMRGPARRAQREALDRLLRALPPDARVTLLAADWDQRVLAADAAPAALGPALDQLDARVSAGALDLERALGAALDEARALHAAAVVWLGIGADAFPGDALGGPLAAYRARGVALLTVGEAVPEGLRDVAALTGGRALDGELDAGRLQRVLGVLGAEAPSVFGVEVERWLPLATADGEVRWVGRSFGDLPAGAARGDAQTLAALWARASIAGGGDPAEGIDPGLRHQILSPLTSILVLEREADYARWGLGERQDTARWAGVLGGARSERGAPFDGLLGEDAAPARDDQEVTGGLIDAAPAGGGRGRGTLGVGRVGTIGRGTVGAGYGLPTSPSIGERRAAVPRVMTAAVVVRGSLGRDIIRRVVRRHLNEVRFCYEKELEQRPGLAGTVAVRFTILPGGTVRDATIERSTLSTPLVAACVAQAVRRWEFPSLPPGGLVVVSYPFVFQPAGHPPPPDPWTTARAALEKGEPWRQAVAPLRPPAIGRADGLAWWLVAERVRSGQASSDAFFVVADLLRQGGASAEVPRVLSEVFRYDNVSVHAELMRLGFTDDARRGRRLLIR